MPPKKKARQPSRGVSTPSTDPTEPVAETLCPVKLQPIPDDPLQNLWTNEQETLLFRSMIRWKPVGMHKHFRMIAISETMRSHGFTSPQDCHTRIPGIWDKLGKLYDIEALDEREDGFDYKTPKDSAREPYCPFELPDDEYWGMMFARRLASDGKCTPPALPYQLSGELRQPTGRYTTVDDTDGPYSSLASNRGQKSAYSNHATKCGRKSQLAGVSRKARRGSKASVDQSTEADEKEERDEDAMEVDIEEKETSKDTPKASKTVVGGSQRRSGRRR